MTLTHHEIRAGAHRELDCAINELFEAIEARRWAAADPNIHIHISSSLLKQIQPPDLDYVYCQECGTKKERWEFES